MPSTRERVILAVMGCVERALPKAKVVRNAVKPQTIPADGYAIVEDGDPGEPDVTLNPTTYLYTHRVPVTLAIGKQGVTTAEARIDEMLAAIGTEVAQDRTLGGLCDYVVAEAPRTEALEAPGAIASRLAEVGILAVYGTTDPLN